jgi:hypothetical protein
MYLMTESELERLFPQIPWRTSVRISRLGCQLQYYGCRFCIVKGLHANNIETECFETEEEFQAHLETEHGRDAEGEMKA